MNGPFLRAWRERRRLLSGNVLRDLEQLGLDIDDVWPVIDREVDILMRQPKLRGRLSLLVRFAMLRGIVLGIIYQRQQEQPSEDHDHSQG